VEWITKNFAKAGFRSFEELCKECVKTTKRGDQLFENDQTMDMLLRGRESSTGEKLRETRCGRAIDLAMKDMGIEVARDGRYDSSWYIRERAAIQRFGGTPEEVLHLLTTEYYWKGRPLEYGHSSIFSLTLQTLTSLPDVPLATIRKVLVAIKAGTPKESDGDGYELAWIKPLWEANARVFEAYLAAAKKGRLVELRGLLENYHRVQMMGIAHNSKYARLPDIEIFLAQLAAFSDSH
jgi:hypothetical protein